MELSVVRTRVEAVVEYLCPDEVGAGLLEDAGEAGDVPPGGDDVGHGGPVLCAVVTVREERVERSGGVAPAFPHPSVPGEVRGNLEIFLQN